MEDENGASGGTQTGCIPDTPYSLFEQGIFVTPASLRGHWNLRLSDYCQYRLKLDDILKKSRL